VVQLSGAGYNGAGKSSHAPLVYGSASYHHENNNVINQDNLPDYQENDLYQPDPNNFLGFY